jgi:hypothetical protein
LRVPKKLDINPGQEMIQAIKSADETGANIGPVSGTRLFREKPSDLESLHVNILTSGVFGKTTLDYKNIAGGCIYLFGSMLVAVSLVLKVL